MVGQVTYTIQGTLGSISEVGMRIINTPVFTDELVLLFLL